MRRYDRLLWTVLVLAVAPGGTVAQSPPATGEELRVHPEAREAIAGLRSPFCPGQMLEVCTSAGGAALRDTIQALAERGVSADSIIERVVAQYGEEWRAEPLRRGVGLVAWLAPPLVLAVGVGAVGLVLARRRRLAEPHPPAKVDEGDEARLREAMRELDLSEQPDW